MQFFLIPSTGDGRHHEAVSAIAHNSGGKMRYFTLEPEVPGGLDDECECDFSVQPPKIDKLVVYFDDWLGDELLISHPAFFVAQKMTSELTAANLSGFRFALMKVNRSQLFDDLHEDDPLRLPEFAWLQVHGEPGADDFGVTAEKTDLVVLDRALAILKRGSLNHCGVAPFDDNARRKGTR